MDGTGGDATAEGAVGAGKVSAVSAAPALAPTSDAPDPSSIGMEDTRRSRFGRFRTIAGRVSVVMALLSGLASFLILTGATPISPDHDVVVATLLVNLIFVLVLTGLIGWEAWIIYQARRQQRAAARLHIQIIGLFCVVAAVPAILLAVIASVTLDRGLDRWFQDRTRSIIDNSITVARAYVREHSQIIRADLLAMSNDITAARQLETSDPDRFTKILSGQAILRGLPGAFIIDENKQVLYAAETPRPISYRVPPDDALARARDDNVALLGYEDGTLVAAITPLGGETGQYLVVMRPLDPRVIQYLRQAEAGVAEFRSLEQRRYGVQLAFGLMYLGLGLIVLLSATWIGIGFANHLVSPIRRLMGAAKSVSEGDLNVSVPMRRAEGDLGTLATTFNTMTSQLRTQRDALLTANKMLDRRRRFTEAVLSGVTAGVIGIDRDGKVTLINRSALQMIGMSQPTLIGKPLTSLVPELGPLIEGARRSGKRLTQGQLSLERDSVKRAISVRVGAEQSGATDKGYVVTLDDITELVNAQRGAAWADIARRIAHEIKNPLTPIQLSAERLRRKYGRMIDDGDRAVFDQCTDTIIRQVGDIGRMVDEFSSFARMPKPSIAPADLAEVVRESVFMMRVGNPDIALDYTGPDDRLEAPFDRRLVAQVLTNLIKNASEAIDSRRHNAPDHEGRIVVNLGTADDRAVIDVTDNGIGLPKIDRAKLLEPYITHREKGTGLGLAIVRKIMDDHGGAIELLDAPNLAPGDTGARMRAVETDEPDAPADTASRNPTSSQTPILKERANVG